jgi:hypothetical protein
MVYDINQFMNSERLPSMASEQPQDGDSLGNVPVDHERLRYVTKLLGSPPALNMALLGTLLFFGNVIALGWPSGWWTLLEALAIVVFGRTYLPAYERWIPEYYQKRFGSVQAARKPWSKWDALFFLAFLLAFLVLLFVGEPSTHYLGPVASSFLGHLHTMISDPARQINLFPSVFWVLLFCGSLRWHMSSVERQKLYFILFGMIGFASIVCYAMRHPDAKQLVLWKILNAGGFGLSFIALGLYDHIVLVRALPKTVREGNDE